MLATSRYGVYFKLSIKNHIFTYSLQHLIGWKRATDTRLHQHNLLKQMEESVLIFNMKNLNLNDLTNSHTLNPTSAESVDLSDK